MIPKIKFVSYCANAILFENSSHFNDVYMTLCTFVKPFEGANISLCCCATAFYILLADIDDCIFSVFAELVQDFLTNRACCAKKVVPVAQS